MGNLGVNNVCRVVDGAVAVGWEHFERMCLLCGVIDIGTVCAGKSIGLECIVRCTVCCWLQNQSVWVMVAYCGGALNMCFCYMVLYGCLSTTAVFGVDAKGITTINWRKGNLIVIGNQQWVKQCGQAGRGVADGWGGHHAGKQMEACFIWIMHRIQYQGSLLVCSPKSTPLFHFNNCM